MCAMKIALSRLLTDALTAEIPRAGAGAEPHRFEVAHGVSLRGTYESVRGETRLSGVAAESVDLSALTTFVGSTSIRAKATAFREPGGDLTIAESGTRAALRAVEISAHEAAIDVGADMAFAIDEITASGARLGLGPLTAGADAVRAAKVHVRIGALEIAIERVQVRGLAVQSRDDGTHFGAEEVTVEGVAFEAAGSPIRVERAALRNPRYGAGALAFDAAEISRVEVSVPRLGGDASASPPPGARAASSSSAPIDLAFLDLLSGHVDVDVHVDARIPVIHRRSAVHRLRVPVEHGVIDFHELERNLSFLEDAVLDFEVKGSQLILEKDVPLIPFDNETLVSWSLDTEGMRLAEDHKVRLRTLAHPAFPAKPPPQPGEDAKKPGFQLEKLDFDPVSIALTLAGPASIRASGVATKLGTADTAAVAAVAVHGAVRHRPESAPEPGALEITAEGISAEATSVTVGNRVVTIAEATIGAVARAAVTFVGLSPRTLVADVRDVSLGATTVSR